MVRKVMERHLSLSIDWAGLKALKFVRSVVLTGLVLGGLMCVKVRSGGSQELPKGWQWVAPVGGQFQKTDDGWVVSVPDRDGGFNHWSGTFNAPMLLTTLPEGDWDAEGTVRLSQWAEDADFHCGIAVAVSEKYVWIWGPFYSQTTWGMKAPEIWLERTGEARLLQGLASGKAFGLKVEKRGAALRFYWRTGGRMPWQDAGQSLIWFQPKKIGWIVKTWGKGRAMKVAFSDLTITPQPAPPQPLAATVIVNTEKKEGIINPMIYGHFIEHLGRCIYGGIWAELLYNRKMHGLEQPSGVVEGWEPFGSDATWAADRVVFYVAGQSQRITGTGTAEHGIQQKRIGLLPKDYVGRIIVRGDGVEQFSVSLRRGEEILAQQPLGPVTNRWTTHRFRLSVKERTEDASFVISFRGKGTLWVGVASLMPADHWNGMRKDVLDAIKDIRPPVVRWPGGNFVSGYHWKDGLGDRDKRPPRWDRAWNAWEWNDFGTDDFIRFCRYVGATPYICANAGEGYEDEAAEWMRYCKEKGFVVPFWGIGNEMYGNWQLGHLSAERYALKSILFYQAMKKVDPKATLITVGVDGAGWDRWNEKVVRIAGHHMDMLAVHYYQGYNPNDDPRQIYTVVVSSPQRIEALLRETNAIIEANAPKGKKIPIAFDEWNVWEPHQTVEAGLESFYALRDGLFAAAVFHTLHRCSDFVEMANLAQTVNVLGAIRTSATQVVKTPIYWAFWLYVRNTGKWRLPIKVATPSGTAPVGGPTPILDASASLSADEKSLFVSLINRHPEESLSLSLDIGTFAPAEPVEMWQLWSPSFMDTNTFKEPDQVKPEAKILSVTDALRLALPRHSVTILHFRRK
ncbi:MAG: hypothetical protein NZ959_05670 [Armatimonadetes bacterium]|nr:hypothetical protein [Armatimonadota bacterium]MDW8122414.1 alpha-L-arabinofuranosidase C-terminal domain-containing protein [Armatimonadota bacterium]